MAASRSRSLTAGGLIGLIAVAGLVGVAGRASSAPDLPPLAPERLIASVLRSEARMTPVAGQVHAHIDLGLPALVDVSPVEQSGLAGLVLYLSGDHRLRIWRSADGFRVADMMPASERAIYVSRTDAWAWDFETFTAYHLGPFARGASRAAKVRRPWLHLIDPLRLARRSLRGVSPTTRVSMGETSRVAGRDVYVLLLEPRTRETLVGRIEIAIDAERRVPLGAAVYPRGAGSPALDVRFTSVSFDAIDPSVYSFTPPEGATVKELGRANPRNRKARLERMRKNLLERRARLRMRVEAWRSCKTKGAQERLECMRKTREAGPRGLRKGLARGFVGPDARIRVFGEGWATIVAVRTAAPSTLTAGDDGLDLRSLLPLSGPLFSARLVDRGDHGWLLYGAVPQAALAAVAPELP
jgi:hypothetical protein